MSHAPPHPLGGGSGARPVMPDFSYGRIGPAESPEWRGPPTVGGAQARPSEAPVRSRAVRVSSPGVSSPSCSRAFSALVPLMGHSSQHKSVLRVANGPLVPHDGAVICSASWALFTAIVRRNCDRRSNRSGPFHSDIRVAPAKSGKLDVILPTVTGSRSATDQSVQGSRPQLMKPIPALARLRINPKSANEIPR
jgi:hypothetical protein